MRYGTIEFDNFDWDNGNISKIKARVAIEKVEGFFREKLLIKRDTRHSFMEERWIAMGDTTDNKCLFVAYTMREIGGEKLLRPISARYTHGKEREAYEEIKKRYFSED